MTSWDHSIATTITVLTKKGPDERSQSILMALDPFKLLSESSMGTGGLMDRKVEEMSVNRGQVVPITPSIKRSMYIIYLCILFHRNQIILPKSEQGSNIEA